MKIGIVGDFNLDNLSQQATNDALIHSSDKLGIPIEHDWIPTASIPEQMDKIRKTYKGFWIAPDSPLMMVVTIDQSDSMGLRWDYSR